MKEVYFSGLPAEAAHLLSIAGWGWHAENGLHALRLIVTGLFDRFPELQIVLGHMGEGCRMRWRGRATSSASRPNTCSAAWPSTSTITST